ncbi:MAG: hypothetical protein ACI83B_000302 [Sediminicola sp.]|jgi:hypothetical protein
MKTLCSLALVSLFLIVTKTNAQEQYTVDGKQYSLYTEIEGPLSLLWNTIDSEYRYFSKKGDVILELTNTKVDGKFQEEFKETLTRQTSDSSLSVEKVKLTRPSLASFYVLYNSAKDPNFSYETKSIKLKTRIGAFGGVTNNIFNGSISNDLTPAVGIDFEIIDNVILKRHSVVVRFKQVLNSNNFESSTSQFSLNYRYKFVKKTKFDMFLNTKIVAYTYSSEKNIEDPDSTMDILVKEAGGNLIAPVAFGIGADYAIGNGYITFSFNDIVAIGVTSNGEFPTDFTLGYRFSL